jgi:hypothetical protein
MQVPILNLDGAWAVLRAAAKNAQRLFAPSSLVVVDARR